MKNYWTILQDHVSFEYLFIIEKDNYDIELVKELLALIVSSGMEYRVAKVLDRESGVSYHQEFLKLLNSELDNFQDINAIKPFHDFFSQAFPSINKGYRNPYVIVTELAFYNQKGDTVIKEIFDNSDFYPLLNPFRVHLYHYSETSTFSPLSLELVMTKNRELNLRVASGLGLWLPYYKPDYDMDKQSLKDFPINEFGYIDNRELYLLNTPRLIGFIKDLRRFFETHNGKERSNNAQLEKFPEFPWYKI